MNLDQVDVSVGAKIRHRRRELGLTQEEIAKSLNISFQQLQKYERGWNRVSASKLFALSKILNVSPGFFFERSHENFVGDEIAAFASAIEQDAECRNLNAAFLQIGDAALKRAIVALVEKIANQTTNHGAKGGFATLEHVAALLETDETGNGTA